MERKVYRSIALLIALLSAYGCLHFTVFNGDSVGLAIISGSFMLMIGLSFINDDSSRR
jgi:hypothetical protein